jgi:hypothetical protein
MMFLTGIQTFIIGASMLEYATHFPYHRLYSNRRKRMIEYACYSTDVVLFKEV